MPRGRPRLFDIDEALAAALQLFWRRGYEGASMTELAAEMGIGKPSLYATFGNKEELFKKALDLYEREKMAYIAEALKEQTSCRMAERLLQGALEMQTSSIDPKGCLCVISSVARGPKGASIRKCVIERQDSLRQAVKRRLEDYKKGGNLPADVETEALARYIIAVLQGVSIQAGADACKHELESVIKVATRIWPAERNANR